MGGDHPRNLRPPGSRGGPHLALITKEILPPETVRIRGFANRLCRRTALEPDPSVSFWCLRRLLLGWLTLRRLVQVLYATHQQLWPYFESGGELADRGRVRSSASRLELRDRIPRHPTPLGQLLLAHHSPLPYAPQTRNVHAPYPQNTAKNLHKTYNNVTLTKYSL